MNRLFFTVKQLLPSFWWIAIHFVAVLILSTAVAFGLEADGQQNGKLWGLDLRFPGFTAAEKLASCCVEMHGHAWTILTLPIACLVVMKPVVRSLSPSFVQFLRFSSSSPQFVEAARLLAIAMGGVLLLLPYVGGLILNYSLVGFSLGTLAEFLTSISACTLFVCTLVYVLASAGLATEFIAAGSLAAPFLLSGSFTFLERSNFGRLASLLPPGLPYTTDGALGSQVKAAVLIAVMTVVVRLVWAIRTRTLQVAKPLPEPVES